ncbi:hypothetical protein D1AOALGA4SA_8545 [Olavius algarvensis Delta 1 endosymbiont]|nr:hypothetical protein D1AOALGA4SA_8545 [Olavius algarvensis Delta 1 endosymbiont]
MLTPETRLRSRLERSASGETCLRSRLKRSVSGETFFFV